jgi:hypothetical protein
LGLRVKRALQATHFKIDLHGQHGPAGF